MAVSSTIVHIHAIQWHSWGAVNSWPLALPKTRRKNIEMKFGIFYHSQIGGIFLHQIVHRSLQRTDFGRLLKRERKLEVNWEMGTKMQSSKTPESSSIHLIDCGLHRPNHVVGAGLKKCFTNCKKKTNIY
jgi:hypothetical protein